MDIMFGRTALSRAEKELIGVIVSVANGCPYCHAHHEAALNAYWKDRERIEQLKEDFRLASLSPKELALCHFAAQLTKYPSSHEKTDHAEQLEKLDLPIKPY